MKHPKPLPLWPLTAQEWNLIFKNDNLEQTQKVFYWLDEYQQKLVLETFGDRDCFKVVKYILNESNFPHLTLSSIVETMVLKWKSLKMIKFILEILKIFDSDAFSFAINHGKLEIIKFLTEEKGLDPNKSNYSWLVCRCGQLNVVKYFVENGKFDLNAQYAFGKTISWCLAEKGQLQILKYVIEQGADFRKANQMGFTPLHAACAQNQLEIAKYLVDELHVDVNEITKNGESCIWICSQNGSLEVAKFLIERKSDLNKMSFSFFSPLIIACDDGKLSFVKMLVENGCDLSTQTIQGDSPLSIACQAGNLNIVEYLLSKKIDLLNKVNNDGESSLFHAVSHGHFDIVKYLVHVKSCDLNLKNKAGQTALSVANSSPKLRIIANFLQGKGAE